MSEIFSSWSGLSLTLPGDVTDPRGLVLLFDGVPDCDSLRCNDELGVSMLGFDDAVALGCDLCFSASLRSMAPRSLRPASSSVISPDILSSCSMRPRRFSRPSMYFALSSWSAPPALCLRLAHLPFGRVSLLLNMCEDAFCLVIGTMTTFR